MLPPSGAKRLRKMILPHMSGGGAPPRSGFGAKPAYSGVTIASLGDYRVIRVEGLYALYYM